LWRRARDDDGQNQLVVWTSLGLFAVGPGHDDAQEPHSKDEVYVVVTGSAVLLVEEERTCVNGGSVAYVPAGVPHRFVDVSKELRVLVVFAPPGG